MEDVKAFIKEHKMKIIIGVVLVIVGFQAIFG